MTFLILILAWLGGVTGGASDQPASFTAAHQSAPGDCGKCVDGSGLLDPIHQFVEDFIIPTHECSGGGGHPIHDCVNGDGFDWSPGPCESKHASCSGFALIEELSRNQAPMTMSAARNILAKSPSIANYNPATRRLQVTDCSGIIIGVFDVTI